MEGSPISLCKACNKEKCEVQSNFCSIACREEWKLLCKVCRKRKRTNKHYCGDHCRDMLEKYSRGGRTRPICVPFLETGSCTEGDRCFGHHTLPPAWDGCLVLPTPRSHSERIVQLVETECACTVLKKELSITSRNHLKVPENLIMNPVGLQAKEIMKGSNTEQTAKELAVQSMVKIGNNSLLDRLVRRVFYIDSFAISEEELVKQLVEQRFGTITEQSEDSEACAKCRIVSFPRNFGRQLAQDIIKEMPSIQSLLTYKSDFNVVLFVVQAADKRYYHGMIDLRLLDKDTMDKFRQTVNSPATTDEDLKVVCRAHFKIMEGFERLNIELSPNAKAIDIGASPGGWSYYLADRCRTVIAVDPGKLKEPIPANVVHYPSKVEDCCAKVCNEHGGFSALVCDMNIAPHLLLQTAFDPFRQSLNDNAVIFLTVKNFTSGKTKKRLPFQEIVGLVAKDLARDCVDVVTLHLMSNSESERTVVGRFSQELSTANQGTPSAMSAVFCS